MQRALAGLLASMSVRGGNIGAIGRIGGAALLQRQGANLGAGTLGALAPDVLKLASSLVHLPKKLHDFSNALVESRRDLAQFNGQIGAAYGRLYAGDIKRSVRSGRGQAESARDLADSVNRMRDALEPIKTKLSVLLNIAGAYSAKSLGFWAEVGNQLGIQTGLLEKEDLAKEAERKKGLDRPPFDRMISLLASRGEQRAGERPKRHIPPIKP